MHVADDKRRLRSTNPTQINQLELNLLINEKSDMFKGMSKTKGPQQYKKHNKI
jgi:hypothetical protein